MLDRCAGSIKLEHLAPQSSTLKHLDLYETLPLTLDGIERFTGLELLRIKADKVNDLAAVGGVISLHDLQLLIRDDVIDLAWISNLHGLQRLLVEGRVRNSVAITSLRALKSAYLGSCRNLSVLQGLCLQALLPKCHFEFDWSKLESGSTWIQTQSAAIWMLSPLIRLVTYLSGASRIRMRISNDVQGK